MTIAHLWNFFNLLTLLFICGCTHLSNESFTSHKREFIDFPFSASGKKMVMELFVPQYFPFKKAPLCLFIHGYQISSKEGGSTFINHPLVKLMEQNGYVVLFLSHPGYGNSTGPSDFFGPLTDQFYQELFSVIEKKYSEFIDFGHITLISFDTGSITAHNLLNKYSNIKKVIFIDGVFDLFTFWDQKSSQSITHRRMLKAFHLNRQDFITRSPNYHLNYPLPEILLIENKFQRDYGAHHYSQLASRYSPHFLLEKLDNTYRKNYYQTNTIIENFLGYSKSKEELYPDAQRDLESFDFEVKKLNNNEFLKKEKWHQSSWVKNKISQQQKIDLELQRLKNHQKNFTGQEKNFFLNGYNTRKNLFNQDFYAFINKLLNYYQWIPARIFGEENENFVISIMTELSKHDYDFELHLTNIEKKLDSIEMSPFTYALLKDTHRFKKEQKQIYGTLGKCVDKFKWRPLPIIDEKKLDQRREKINLEKFEFYQLDKNRTCEDFVTNE